MIDHPFLSFKDLSDDDLLEKTTELQKNLNRAHMWGSSQEIIGQLIWMLDMIEEEKLERWKKQNFDMMNSAFPEIVESDPEFKNDKPETEVVKSSKPVRKTHSLPMPNFNKEYVNKDKKV